MLCCVSVAIWLVWSVLWWWNHTFLWCISMVGCHSSLITIIFKDGLTLYGQSTPMIVIILVNWLVSNSFLLHPSLNLPNLILLKWSLWRVATPHSLPVYLGLDPVWSFDTNDFHCFVEWLNRPVSNSFLLYPSLNLPNLHDEQRNNITFCSNSN